VVPPWDRPIGGAENPVQRTTPWSAISSCWTRPPGDRPPDLRGDLGASAILGLLVPVAFVGCGEESKVEEKTTVKTPEGSTTKTITTEVEKTGDHKTNP